jgi:AcrR family transcriptional regulator
MSPRPARALRGRVGDDPAIALRDLLIDTAERLIGERPPSSLTTREIARAAGVSDGVLYNYFADKNDLVLTALVRRHTRTLGSYDLALPEPGSGDVVENLTACARAAIDLVGRTLPAAGALFSEPDLLHRFFAEIHRSPLGPERMVGPIAGYLAGEQQLGRLGTFDAEAAATLLLGSAIMLGLTAAVDGSAGAQLDARLLVVVRTLLGGLAVERAG